MPGLSSDNVFSHLEENLKKHKVFDRVDIFETASSNRKFLDDFLIPYLKKNPIGFLMIDADGQIDRDLNELRPYLLPGCFVMIDDYMMQSSKCTQGFANKSIPSQKAVHNLVNSGQAVSLGVYLWNTWFGQIV